MSKGVFHKIAPIYGLFYDHQVRYYRKILKENKDFFDFSEYSSVVDIGFGTGALCRVLAENGLSVTGIEPVEKMIRIAKKKNADIDADCVMADVLHGLPFEDNTFDVSISSYVAHGMKKEDRMKMYREMARVTGRKMIIYDYNQERRWANDFVEWLEGGDYFNFIQVVQDELMEEFGNVVKRDVDERAAWYLVDL
ncbi:class I SAM-dependent methyltransferase [Gudongella sp. DL1XJH-153]|uniref:class I SAM-dependent methyltransferase n=1 Tax=Gudongella sp. DL1XJH-153 TaxID=3409804 RepID=UPI003BB80E49